MKLYFSPGACSLSPHIVLQESGLPFTLEKVDLRTHQTAGGTDFYQINPKGYVPALQLDDGQLLTEGPAIVQYVADLAPDKKIAPPNGTLGRVRLQEWLAFIGTEIHKGYSTLWNRDASASDKDAAWKKLSQRYDLVEKQLAEQDYLLGQFSAADAYLFVCTNWAGMHQRSLDNWPKLQAFMTRMKARPSVQAALKAEGLL
ncbi:glutathione transferase GstA [Chitinimonas lacunae]|uniref:Glutathione transferase GstA n=1 Tax=Chitinimonas lacunae TaxID=1963018 RepID=A0ABV8MT20_9NEIS